MNHFRQLLLLFTISCFLSSASSAQKILYVDSAATGNNNGQSWKNAFTRLAPALYLANNGNGDYIIRVAKGTYYPTKSNGKPTTSRDSSFRILRNKIQLQGGYPNGGGSQNISANPTILNGNIGNKQDSLDNVYHILTIITSSSVPLIDSTTIVNGFTFKEGYGNSTTTDTINGQAILRSAGGAIYNSSFKNYTCNPTISNCNFTENYATRGGGIYNTAISDPFKEFGFCSPTIENCIFLKNSAIQGGAISCFSQEAQSNCIVNNCSYTENKASSMGGAVYVQTNSRGRNSPVLNNCSFTNNYAPLGGAIANSGNLGSGSISANYCVFTGNAATNGGAAYCIAGSSQANINISNGVLINNIASEKGGAIYMLVFNVFNNAILDHCLLEQNTAASGGAIYTSAEGEYPSAYVTLNSCSLINNNATDGGACYHNATGTPGGGISSRNTYNKCTFSGNNATNNGGAIYNNCRVESYYVTMESSVFSNNKCGGRGGMMYSYGTSFYAGMGIYYSASIRGRVINSSFYNNNSLKDSGNTIYHDFPNNHFFDTVKLSNCIVWENKKYGSTGSTALTQNTAVFLLNNTLLQGTTSPGTILTGNSASLLNTFPKFTDTSNLKGPDGIWATSDDGLALKPRSMAINKGNNALLLVTDTTDITGAPRIQCDTVDLGAYERYCTKLVAHTGGDNVSTTPVFIVYPNPAHGSVNIQTKGYAGKIQLVLTDINGQTVCTLKESKLPGDATIRMPLPNLANGIYLLKIITADGTRQQKLLVE